MLKPFPIFPSEFSKLIDVRLGGILLNSWMVLCSILLVNYLILKLAKSRTVAKEIITLIIIFFCYEFLLILAYIFTFDSYEASYVASLNRYNSSILLAVSLLMLKNLINLVQVKKLFTSSIGIGCLFIIAFATPQPLLDDLPHLNDMPARSSFAFQEENISNQNARKSVMGVNRILQTFRSNSTYFISQNSKGLEKYIFNYEVLPNLSNYGCWSIGEPYVSDDIWTCKGNLIDYISNYEYLVIYYSDSEFWQLNSNLLVDLSMRRKSGIYKIEKKGEQLVLRLVRPLSAHYPSLPIAEAKIERVQNIRLI